MFTRSYYKPSIVSKTKIIIKTLIIFHLSEFEFC